MPLAATLLTVGSLLPSSYDLLCENIVSHAKAAARLHNAGKAAAAEMEAVAAVKAYRSAVELEPSEPQAYLHAGQAMYNMQRFDDAIAAFTSAGEGTPPHTSAPPHLRTSAPPHLRTSALSAPRDLSTSQESAFLPTGAPLAASPGVSTSLLVCVPVSSARGPSRATRPTQKGRAT
jgi:tetratricopeptide (TPR) repeat protein